MAVRVKVNRLKLIARLEAVRDEAKKGHAAALKKFAADSIKARQAAARDLRKKADHMDDLSIRISSTTEYRGRADGHEQRVNVLCIDSPVVVPRKPEPHHALSDIERTIFLLDQSDDEVVSINTDDFRYYGIGNLLGLND